jgi:uncharacterized protein YndB with AHSA1/START domain
MTTISVSRDVAAPARELWAMVSDVTRMGEWSPESVGGRWVGGATGPAVGARFRGRNQHGWRRWSTACRVVACEPGREFTFDVTSVGFGVARWSYTFEPTDDGTRVTESWTDHRNALVKMPSQLVSGVSDRAEHNRAGMEATLAKLAEAAESQPAA